MSKIILLAGSFPHWQWAQGVSIVFNLWAVRRERRKREQENDTFASSVLFTSRKRGERRWRWASLQGKRRSKEWELTIGTNELFSADIAMHALTGQIDNSGTIQRRRRHYTKLQLRLKSDGSERMESRYETGTRTGTEGWFRHLELNAST